MPFLGSMPRCSEKLANSVEAKGGQLSLRTVWEKPGVLNLPRTTTKRWLPARTSRRSTAMSFQRPPGGFVDRTGSSLGRGPTNWH